MIGQEGSQAQLAFGMFPCVRGPRGPRGWQGEQADTVGQGLPEKVVGESKLAGGELGQADIRIVLSSAQWSLLESFQKTGWALRD